MSKLLTAVIVASVVAYFIPPTRAGAIYEAVTDKATITLYTDNCTLQAVVNLPLRATWTEGGKVFEGCYLPRPDAGLIVFYFSDRTVGLAPMAVFRKVTGV